MTPQPAETTVNDSINMAQRMDMVVTDIWGSGGVGGKWYICKSVALPLCINRSITIRQCIGMSDVRLRA